MPLVGALFILEIETKHDNYIAKAFSLRPIKTLGEISFSMYLVHFRVINHINRWYVSVKTNALIAKYVGFHWICFVVAILTISISFLTENFIVNNIVKLGALISPFAIKFNRLLRYSFIMYFIAYLIVVKQYLGFEYKHVSSNYLENVALYKSDASLLISHDYFLATELMNGFLFDKLNMNIGFDTNSKGTLIAFMSKYSD